jgi:catechol 2,3-dioxygenase-like lactoylglutathione lyase family enzyme
MTGNWEIAPILGVPDVKAAVEFFCATLGFTRPDRLHGGQGEPPVYAIVRRAGIAVHLQIRRGPTAARYDEHESEVSFLVDDVDALHAELAARRVIFLRDIQDEPYGMRDFTIETPFGVRLLFCAPLR